MSIIYVLLAKSPLPPPFLLKSIHSIQWSSLLAFLKQ